MRLDTERHDGGRNFAGNCFHRELCVTRQKEGKDTAHLDGY